MKPPKKLKIATSKYMPKQKQKDGYLWKHKTRWKRNTFLNQNMDVIITKH